jgi:hypothetical protein
MSPPRAVRDRTADPPKAASTSRAAPAPPLTRRFGNDQTLTLLKARQAKASGTSRDASADQPEVDLWTTLSAGGRARAEALFDRCSTLLGELNDAQTAHVSVERAKWINDLAYDHLMPIGHIDSDAKIVAVERAFERYSMTIADRVAGYGAEWAALEHRYFDERGWLARQNFDDATLAVKRLDDLYATSRRWLDGALGPYITGEDYSELKQTLESGSHISTGVLQGSRIRARQVHDLLDVVRELRLDEQDPDKYVPEWRKDVENELDNLDRLAKRTHAVPGTDYPAEFTRLRNELRQQRDAVLQKRPLAERVAVGIAKVPVAGVDAAVGAVEAIVGPFVEAAREILDDAQVGLYYVSGGRYLPRFTSDLMKAFEQGATRTEVLKGLVTGLIGTPQRFLKAVEDGDWEAVGREAVNLYLLARVVKESPKVVARVPELLVTTRRALRVLRARTLGLRLKSARLVPEPPPLPREPVFLRDDPAVVEAPQADTAPPDRVEVDELNPIPDVDALRELFLRVLRSGERGGITVGRVGFGGVQVFVGEDGILTVYRDSIINVDRIRDQGKLMHNVFEEAARAAARQVRVRSVRVAVGTVQNQNWAAYLMSHGYDWDYIRTSPGVHSRVLFRIWTL